MRDAHVEKRSLESCDKSIIGDTGDKSARELCRIVVSIDTTR